jgi:hypothetical protein
MTCYYVQHSISEQYLYEFHARFHFISISIFVPY